MEEHAQREQDVSEEHLQTITGGCEACTSDARAIGGFTWHINNYLSKAEQHANAITNATDTNTALYHRAEQLKQLAKAAAAQNRVADLQQRIAARHA